MQSKTLKNLSAPKISILNADSFIAVQQVGKPWERRLAEKKNKSSIFCSFITTLPEKLNDD